MSRHYINQLKAGQLPFKPVVPFKNNMRSISSTVQFPFSWRCTQYKRLGLVLDSVTSDEAEAKSVDIQISRFMVA